MATDDYGDDPAGRLQWRWLLRFTVRRAIADRGVLAPALATCLIATTLLATGPILTRALTDAGLRSTLAAADTTTRDLRVTAPLDSGLPTDLDATARRGIERATAPVDAPVHRQLRSGTFALVGRPELVEFAWLDDADRIRYAGGRPPERTDEVALPAAVADILAMRVGDAIEVADTSTDTPARLRLSGIYRVSDRRAVRWWGAPPVDDAEWERGGFTIYGPLLVARSTLVETLGAEQIWWTTSLPVDRIDAAVAERIGRGVRAFAARSGDGLQVDTGLADLLADVRRRLLASRAGVLTMVLQLLLLAVYGLTLAARLIIAERETDSALLRTRGAGPAQLTAITIVESAIVVLPGVVVAPALARVVVDVMDDHGAFAAAGLALKPTVTGASIAMACVAGIAALLTLTLPAVRAHRRPATEDPRDARQRRIGGVQRAGLDVALLGIAVIGYWQLRQSAGPLTSSVRGVLGIDPLLVTAPALCLLAGSVLALRAVPLFARLGEQLARTGRSVVPALSAWQIARRPRSYARAALLPLLALALGVFAVTYGQTRQTAQAARATDRVMADLRVTPGQASTTDPALSSAYRQVDGVTTATPVRSMSAQVSRQVGDLGVVAIDTDDAAALKIDPTLRAAVANLTGTRTELPAVGTGDTNQLQLRATITRRQGEQTGPPPDLELVVRDGHGLLHTLDVGTMPIDGRAHDLRADLAGFARPVSLVGIDLVFPADLSASRHTYGIGLDFASPVQPAADPGWIAIPDVVRNRRIPTPPAVSTDDRALRFVVEVGPDDFAFDDAVVHLRPGAMGTPEPIGLIVDTCLQQTLDVATGDPVTLRVANTSVVAQVTDVVAAIPGLPEDADAGGALVDLGAFAALTFDQTQRTVAPMTWLLDVEGDPASVGRELRDEPFNSTTVLEYAQVAASQQSDPVALGVTGSLTLGFGAAALLAAVGFVVAAIASVRERVTEFALLRAIGLSRRQLAAWLSVEQGLVLIGSLAGGVLLGGAMAWLILPFTTLDASGERPTTAVAVQLDPAAIAGLVAVIVGAIALTLVVLARPLRRLRLGQALRTGDVQ